MSHLMAQVSAAYFTNLPKDVATNTFHFEGEGDVAEDAVVVAGLLQAFYNDEPSSGTNRVGAYLSPVVKRTIDGLTVKVYDMSQPRPRVPVFQTGWSPPTALSATMPLPLEVAICNSFSAAREPGVPPARRRGRIFLGPLVSSAISGGSVSSFPTVAGSARTTLTEASNLLAVDSRAAGVPWSVYSRVSTTLAPVIGGWVDNEPDTQRRRQASPSERLGWSLTV